MGSWGYMPSDGDGSQDLLDGVKHDAIWPRVERLWHPLQGRTSSDHYNRVGVVEHLATVCEFWVPENIARLCVRDLEACLKDEKWIQAWREPECGRTTVKGLIEIFQTAADKGEVAQTEVRERLLALRESAEVAMLEGEVEP